MHFTKSDLEGAFVIEPEELGDERGFFARVWDQNEFRKNTLETRVAQCSISYNKEKGTLRGLHYQVAPYEEVKIVRVTRGSVYDVIVDLRSYSPTYMKWIAMVLSAENRKMLYVPKGVAHGFQTLEDNTEISYQISEFYSPEHSRGIRWNDPQFSVKWPDGKQIMSDRDGNCPDYHPIRVGAVRGYAEIRRHV